MKIIVRYAYDFVDFFRYIFLNIRRPLNRPLYVLSPHVRKFVQKYGQNGEHYSFVSIDSGEQKEFLTDYEEYLKNIKKNNKTTFKLSESNLEVVTELGSKYSLFFNTAGELVYTYQGLASGTGAGRLGLTFEINI